MRLCRIGPAGSESPAVQGPDGILLDATPVTRDFDAAFLAEDGLTRLRAALKAGSLSPIAGPPARFGSPIARPPKIVCIGLNYAAHAAEAELALPEEPTVFLKASNTVVGPDDDVLIPVGSDRTDWEVELGIVIGATARYLPNIDAARDCIAGYTVTNDVSERTFQLERGGQWTKGKCCETFNPLGPWLVTTDEVRDPQDLRLRCSVNGEVMQDGSTADMIMPALQIVQYLSAFMVLEPGDLINTGTPAGVGMGRRPQVFLREGDVMELEIEGLGRQRQTARQAQA